MTSSRLNITWAPDAWDDYVWWHSQDKRTLKKINQLILSISRDGYMSGEGHPEPLKANLEGFWSRRINEKDRLVYEVDEVNIYIASCRSHY
jgi:toxin YoeB